MLAAFRPEPVRKTQKVLFPNLVENCPYRSLGNLVFQRRDSQWSLPSIGFRYPDSPRRFRPIAPTMDSPMQVGYPRLQFFSIFLPRHAIHSRRRLPLQAVVAAAQQINTDVVQQGCEPYFLVLPGCLSHPVQPAWLAFPSLRPVRVGLFHVLLGQRPSLHGLLRPSPAFVRPLPRYYAAVRLPAAVPLRLIAHRLLPAFPVLPSTDGRGASRFSRLKFLCMRGVFDSAGPDALALARTSVLPSALLDAVGTLIFAISELTTSGYPACICPCPTLQVRP